MGLDFTSCKYMFNFKKLGPKVLLSSANTRKITFLLQFWKEKKPTTINQETLVLSYLTVSLLITVFCEKTGLNVFRQVSCENSFEAATSFKKITLPEKLHIAF